MGPLSARVGVPTVANENAAGLNLSLPLPDDPQDADCPVGSVKS